MTKNQQDFTFTLKPEVTLTTLYYFFESTKF